MFNFSNNQLNKSYLTASTSIGETQLELPPSIKLEESQIYGGVVIRPDGTYYLRNYPIWIKQSPSISFINLSYLLPFGYDVDLVFPELDVGIEINPCNKTNFAARKLLVAHFEGVDAKIGPFNEIFLLDNNKKLSLDDYVKIMCIAHLVTDMDWVPGDDLIKFFSLPANDKFWQQLAKASDKEYEEILKKEDIILSPSTISRLLKVSDKNGYNGEYYELVDELIDLLEKDRKKEPDVINPLNTINKVVSESIPKDIKEEQLLKNTFSTLINEAIKTLPNNVSPSANITRSVTPDKKINPDNLTRKQRRKIIKNNNK